MDYTDYYGCSPRRTDKSDVSSPKTEAERQDCVFDSARVKAWIDNIDTDASCPFHTPAADQDACSGS